MRLEKQEHSRPYRQHPSAVACCKNSCTPDTPTREQAPARRHPTSHRLKAVNRATTNLLVVFDFFELGVDDVVSLLSRFALRCSTFSGLSLLGVPLALILGIIAGLLDCIPYVGPLRAGVPAVLIALSVDPQLALYTVLLFLGIQMVHGYVLQPLIDSHTVRIAPGLIIVMQLVFGTIFGFAGIALATPLTATLMVLIKMLYVEDILGDRPQEQDGAPPSG